MGSESRSGTTCKLSPRTEELIERFFEPSEQSNAKHLLMSEPFRGSSGEYCSERLCFAAIKISEGSMEELRRAVDLAQIDFRDLLMAADFGHDVHAHDIWFTRGGRVA